MKYASSIRYGGQLVEASECDYEDYKRLGLLCPECKDPVLLRGEFTRLQHGKDVKVLAHFAHFPGKDPTLVAQCEKRVSKYTPKELQRMAAQARGQRLKLLQRWFWTVFTSQPDYIQRVEKEEGIQIFVQRSFKDFEMKESYCQIICEKHLSHLRQFSHLQKTVNFFFDSLDSFDRSNLSDEVKEKLKRISSVDRRMQKQMSFEVLSFLLSRSQQSTAELLMKFSMIQTVFSPSATNQIKQGAKGLSQLKFVTNICSIPWAEEFDRLQKEEATKQPAIAK